MLSWSNSCAVEKRIELFQLYEKQWWTKGRSFDCFVKMLENSDLIFIAKNDQYLVGFARILTDYVFKAVIYDVIVDESDQNQGIGKQLMNQIINHRSLQNVESF